MDYRFRGRDDLGTFYETIKIHNLHSNPSLLLTSTHCNLGARIRLFTIFRRTYNSWKSSLN